jgi:chaperonin GroES
MATNYLKKIVPLFDRVLVQRVKPQTKVGGIVLPESATQKTNEALVVSVGKGLRNAEGKFTPPLVSPGDTVLLADYRGDEVKVNNDTYLLVREEDILAKLEEMDVKASRSPPASDIPDIRDLPKS